MTLAAMNAADWLETDDGMRLWVWHWPPPNRPRAVLQILHGVAEHAGRYEAFARAADYCAVFAHDQRGHGRSRQSAANNNDYALLGLQGGWAAALEDIRRVTAMARQAYPGLPVFLLGHSMGSFMLQDFMAGDTETYQGFIIMGSDGPPDMLVQLGRILGRLERARIGPAGRSWLLDRMSFDVFNRPFKPNRTDFDWLSRDEKEVDLFIADPYCGGIVPVQTMLDIADCLPRLTYSTHLARLPRSKPVLIISGDRDPVGHMGRGPRQLYEIYRRIGMKDVSLTLYPGGRHEILHETNRDEVAQDIFSWIESRIDSAA